MIDWILCIVLSYIVIRMYWKDQQLPRQIEHRRNTVKNRFAKKRRITDEELITVVLPTINNDGK